MILHQLRTDGSLEFTHISEVIPFFERSLNRGRNLDILPSPRVFKTHLRHHQCPQLGKYIYVHRDGKDVLWSHYHFSRSHLNYKGSFDLFFKQFLEGKIGCGSWFQHVREWEAHARDPNCLFLGYEQLANDLASWLPRIADFCGIVISTDEYPRILERCSFQYMKEHEGKFDHATEILWELGLQHGHFIRQGKVGSWKHGLNETQVGQFDEAARSATLADKRGTIQHVRDFVLGKSTARP